MTGTLTLGGNPPAIVPGGTSGYVLTSDGSGNLTLAPAAGGGGGVTLTPTAVKTGAYTTAAGEFVPCDTQTTGAFTLTLPTGPADKSVVGAKLVKQASTNAVTIACGSGDTFNVATTGPTTRTLALLNQGVLLQYKATGAIWYVMDDSVSLTQLDTRYTQLAGDLGNTTASPTVAKIQGQTIQAPSGGATHYLDATGNWTPPSGGSGASLDTTHDPLALGTAGPGAGANGASCSDHVHPTTGVALLAGAAFTGAVSATNLSASGTFGVTGNATASGTLAVSKRVTAGVVALTDASTISVDASLGNIQRVTINGNRTMGTPSNPADGQGILFEITQGLSAPFTITWGSAYAAGTTVAFPTLTTTAGKMDKLGFRYNATAAKWHLEAVALGF